MEEECKYIVELIDVEGYAMIGMVKSLRIASCKGGAYIEAILNNNERVCTKCIDIKSIELSKRVIDFYTTLNRKGMMIGITTESIQ